jgi:hypothetical protein
MYRRTLLASLPFLAGCSGTQQLDATSPTPSSTPTPPPTATPTPASDSDGDGVVDARDDFPNDPDRITAALSVDESFMTIPASDWQAWEVSVRTTSTLAYDFFVTTDAPVDVFVIQSEQLSAFESGGDVRTVGHTRLATSAPAVDGSLDPGSYHIIIDNSERGEATPAGAAKLQQVTVQVYG